MASNTDKQPVAGPEESKEEQLVQDAVILDMPPFSKFSINVPSEPSRPISTPTSSDRPALSSSESEGDSSDDESGQERENRDTFDAGHSPPISRIRPAGLPGQSAQSHPRFSRTFSLPLPSQLGQLNHPHHKSSLSFARPSYSDPVSPQSSQLKELSLELADSVQMVIQTMLQISPNQVLDPVKEQFSACALAVPTPSMSAMFTVMKNLNYISANMSAFAADDNRSKDDSPFLEGRKHNDFDIGELLQNIGDALSASAGLVGVDLVLFHGEVALKHVWVKGDEPSTSYLLSHVIRQILATCQRGDTIELGLFVNRSSRRQNSLNSESEDDMFRATPLHFEGEEPLQCVIEIFHRLSPASTSGGVSRPQPSFSALATRRLLSLVGATLSEHTPAFDGSLEIGRSSRLSFSVDPGLSPQETPATVTADDNHASEPTLEQLSTFVDSLKGKKVHLYANSKSSFAHHLTSYLTTWGMDVSHLSTEGGVESVPELPPSPTTTLNTSPIEGYTPSGIPPKMEPPRQPKAQPVSFIFIDDDVSVLKERLQAIREEQSYPLNLNLRKRPSLAAHHRPRSSPQVTRISPGTNISPTTPTSVVLLHFTSLANFKVTRDLVQSVLSSYRGTLAPLPEIMIIPKPAGPRRFLTALHTAATKPVVDPFFSPIATTPGTPHLGSFSSPSYSQQQNSPRTPSVHRPPGSRSNSDRSSRSNILENHANLPPSPLSMNDNSTEYFSESVAKMGETGGAVKLGVTDRAGIILQSPDGQPTGIFFSPRAEKTNVFAGYSMERDRGHLSIPMPRRSTVSSNEGPSITFSSLHEVDRPSMSSSRSLRSETPSRQKPRVSVSPTGDKSEIPHIERKTSLDGSRKEVTSTSPPGSPLAGSSVSPLRSQRRPKLDAKGLAPGSAGKTGKSPAEGNIVPPISVLIVDDNPINRTILSTFMKRNKIKYDVAQNGKEAVEKWKTGEFHLILMDIQMPVMDGMEATRTIRQLERVKSGYIQTPYVELHDAYDDSRTSTAASPYRSSVIIVALTASSLQTDRIAALAAGCNDFLTKPVSLQWLNNKLIEWGSIKALTMYADMSPDVTQAQNDQAKSIAERLYVPKGRKTPPDLPGPKTPAVQPATPPASASAVSASIPAPSPSPRSSAGWSPAQPSAVSYRAHIGLKFPIRDESSSKDDSTPTPAWLSPAVEFSPSLTQSPTTEKLNGSIKDRDPNASTRTLTQEDISSSKGDNGVPQTQPSSENVRESGSTSSVSRSPSPPTPATPGSPRHRPAMYGEDGNIKLDDAEGVTIGMDMNIPGGSPEIYSQGGDAHGDSLGIPP